MFTHKQYLAGECSHRQYYAQFVTDKTRETVRLWVSLDRLIASKDPTFSDIPLFVWDGMHERVPHSTWHKMQTEAKDVAPMSLCSSAYIHKEAARQLVEERLAAAH